ncbi:aldo/keto reductase [Marinococcus luteus]|uniref:aldo/keto reductase n=1 Tax=Marinococcus luteus TaxID=1122204 RepID=UPI002ACC8DBA|nr:aldo/keto reductase [Marinococcus luteus]MDZ5781651.1 aldo/keto reductase [Marinococcus luteus]
MKQIQLGSSSLHVSNIALGCMRMNELSIDDAEKVFRAALEAGVNFFDHADIYGGGDSEDIFARAAGMNDDLREKVILQSKAGIRENSFDFSKSHILKTVDESLKRLQTDYLDVLLLHRPDALMEPEEVAEAFDSLRDSGKVRHFGVSNQNPMQIELLKQHVKQDLIANQLQFGLMHSLMVDQGLNVNMKNDAAVMREGGLLEYSQLNNMTVQAWSPFQYGMMEGVFVGNDKFPKVNKKLSELAGRYRVTESAVAAAWILRHPARIQTIVGTMNPERLAGIAEASEITLTREEWYDLYQTAGNELP